MGELTRDLIVSEALELAGNTGLTSRANVWLNAALKSLYMGWDWPFLPTGSGATVALAAGTTYTDIGDGASSVTEQLARINRILVAEPSKTGYKGEAFITPLDEVAPEDHPLFLPSTQTGIPTKATVEAGSGGTVGYGKWRCHWNPIPDRALLLAFGYRKLPSNLSSGSALPLYPADDTLIQAVFVRALEHQEDERWVVEEQKFQAMVKKDRLKFGRAPGQGIRLGLSKKRFK